LICYECGKQFSSDLRTDSVSWKLGQSIPLSLAYSHRTGVASGSSIFSQPQANTTLTTSHMMASEKIADEK